MNQEFKIGDRVLISKTSDYYIDNDINNPKNVEGTIKSYDNEDFDDDLNIEVRWDNGCTNSYNTKDLELVNKSSKVEEEKPKKRRLLIG